jgi:hypothetical protein
MLSYVAKESTSEPPCPEDNPKMGPVANGHVNSSGSIGRSLLTQLVLVLGNPRSRDTNESITLKAWTALRDNLSQRVRSKVSRDPGYLLYYVRSKHQTRQPHRIVCCPLNSST